MFLIRVDGRPFDARSLHYVRTEMDLEQTGKPLMMKIISFRDPVVKLSSSRLVEQLA